MFVSLLLQSDFMIKYSEIFFNYMREIWWFRMRSRRSDKKFSKLLRSRVTLQVKSHQESSSFLSDPKTKESKLIQFVVHSNHLKYNKQPHTRPNKYPTIRSLIRIDWSKNYYYLSIVFAFLIHRPFIGLFCFLSNITSQILCAAIKICIQWSVCRTFFLYALFTRRKPNEIC